MKVKGAGLKIASQLRYVHAVCTAAIMLSVIFPPHQARGKAPEAAEDLETLIPNISTVT